jgi:hypothetical protein
LITYLQQMYVWLEQQQQSRQPPISINITFTYLHAHITRVVYMELTYLWSFPRTPQKLWRVGTKSRSLPELCWTYHGYKGWGLYTYSVDLDLEPWNMLCLQYIEKNQN